MCSYSTVELRLNRVQSARLSSTWKPTSRRTSLVSVAKFKSITVEVRVDFCYLNICNSQSTSCLTSSTSPLKLWLAFRVCCPALSPLSDGKPLEENLLLSSTKDSIRQAKACLSKICTWQRTGLCALKSYISMATNIG